LLELLISLIIISIMFVTLVAIYTTMTTGFFEGSEKMKGIHEKTRIINLIKRDLIYGTEVETLNGGLDLKLIQPDETVIVYSFEIDKLTRKVGVAEPTDILSGLSNVSFQVKQNEAYVTVSSETVGVAGNTIPLAVTGGFVKSAETLVGGAIEALATGTITYIAGEGTVSVDGTTFIYNSGDAEGNNFITIDDLVLDIDALPNVSAKKEVRNSYVQVQGTLTGKTSKSTIDFEYVFELLDKKWEFGYEYPDE